jgi:anti-sigma factor RsiW
MSQRVSDHSLCQTKNIQAYFDDELDSTMRLLVERHLGACPDCEAELAALERLQALIGLAYNGRAGIVPVLQALISKSHLGF